jgi:hypothetical protein
VISAQHRSFVRAVVAAAKENGFTWLSIRFGASFADEAAARWEKDRNGGGIILNTEASETIKPRRRV